MKEFQTFLVVLVIVILIALVPMSPLFTLWSFAALGWSVPVTCKTYFAVMWIHLCLGTLFSQMKKSK